MIYFQLIILIWSYCRVIIPLLPGVRRWECTLCIICYWSFIDNFTSFYMSALSPFFCARFPPLLDHWSCPSVGKFSCPTGFFSQFLLLHSELYCVQQHLVFNIQCVATYSSTQYWNLRPFCHQLTTYLFSITAFQLFISHCLSALDCFFSLLALLQFSNN